MNLEIGEHSSIFQLNLLTSNSVYYISQPRKLDFWTPKFGACLIGIINSAN